MLKRNQLAARETAELHLKDAAGEPMYYTPNVHAAGEKIVKQPVLIEVYGPGSEPYRKAQASAQRKLMLLAKKGRRAIEDRTPEERAEDAADQLADITVRFDGLDLEGMPLRGAVRALYADPSCGYIVSQVNEFAADWANFSTSAPQS